MARRRSDTTHTAPDGRDGIGFLPALAEAGQRSRVVDAQRTRILSAMTAAAAQRGAGNVAVAHVVERAGVSRRTFYELFSDVEDCLLAALDEALRCARQRVLESVDVCNPWRVRIRAGLTALLSLFDEQPDLGRLLVMESLAGGPRALERRRRALAPLIAAVDEGRNEARRSTVAAGLSPIAAESVVGGALSLVYTRMADDGGQPLTVLASGLMSMIVLPYLGHASARRELQAPVSQAAAGPREAALAGTDPFKAAGMRLTNRTMRVLGAVAAEPGASNRRIGDAAGVRDQGQVSKLLSRLERGGLIANASDPLNRGEANAWSLTQEGRKAVQSIGLQAGRGVLPAAEREAAGKTGRK